MLKLHGIKKCIIRTLLITGTISVMANMSLMAQALEFESFVGTGAWTEWNYDGTENFHNGIRIKDAIVNHDAGKYIVVESLGAGPTCDPYLYYYSNGWEVFCDDYNVRNFKVVIHFNAPAQRGLRLGYTHYSNYNGRDTLGYRVTHFSYDTDPQLTNIYYLEVNTDGTYTRVWH